MTDDPTATWAPLQDWACATCNQQHDPPCDGLITVVTCRGHPLDRMAEALAAVPGKTTAGAREALAQLERRYREAEVRMAAAIRHAAEAPHPSYFDEPARSDADWSRLAAAARHGPPEMLLTECRPTTWLARLLEAHDG